MRNSFEEWCETAEISINEIENRTLIKMNAGKNIDTVYLSLDLYAEIVKQSIATSVHNMGPAMGPSASSIAQIWTSGGKVQITRVAKLRNFCLVGTKDDYDAFIAYGVDPIFWDDQERARINKEFEDIVLRNDT